MALGNCKHTLWFLGPDHPWQQAQNSIRIRMNARHNLNQIMQCFEGSAQYIPVGPYLISSSKVAYEPAWEPRTGCHYIDQQKFIQIDCTTPQNPFSRLLHSMVTDGYSPSNSPSSIRFFNTHTPKVPQEYGINQLQNTGDSLVHDSKHNTVIELF